MTHVKDRKPTHFCPECGKGFLKAQALKSHIPLHSGEKNHTCEICSTKFSQEVNMKKHLLVMHGNVPMVSCEVCSKSIKKIHIKSHILEHAKQKQFHVIFAIKSSKQIRKKNCM